MSDADRWSPRLPLPGPEPELEGFDLCQLIASGGTSQVHKAWQKNLHRWVAIKWIQPPLEASEDWVALFRREALATSSLSHPNIVKIFEVGSSAGAIWLALEWVDGVSLAEALCDGPFTTQATLEIMRQIVAALRHAHQRGVVHRDIKPSNILINDEGHVWVADFGIASVRQLGLGDTALMPTLLHAGSALYMAPERLSGHAGTSQPAEDVYAL
ncbi:MAG: serine/threonine protein kinase, partial [Verrucomicrobiales bacterium]|nr:serine/threonine protein kinase [Verrucomicrobiales bacterium]